MLFFHRKKMDVGFIDGFIFIRLYCLLNAFLDRSGVNFEKYLEEDNFNLDPQYWP